MSIALNITVIGLLVVFIGLGGLALFIFVNSKLLSKVDEQKQKNKKTVNIPQIQATQDEIAVISLAIYLTKLFEEQGTEVIQKHKTNSAWFLKSVLPIKRS